MSPIVEARVNRILDSYPVIEEHSPVLREESGGGPVSPPPHPHRWLIAEPKGEYSPGVCTVCGVWKRFRNYDWGHDKVLNVEARYDC